MTFYRPLAVLAAVGVLTLASATSAMAYDEPVVSDVTTTDGDGVLEPGQTFSIAGNYSGSYCDEASADFAGDSGSGSAVGEGFDLTFTAPDEAGDYTVLIFCEYQEDNPIEFGAAEPEVEASATTTLSVADFTVAAAADDDSDDSDSDSNSSNGSLPDTGAPTSQLLLVGAGLVAAGAAVTVADRRRRRA